MLLDEIATYLDASSTALTVGPTTSAATPIFKSRLPADVQATAIALFESGGRSPDYRMTSTVSFERPTIQVLSRSTSYPTARTNAELVFTLLSTLTNSTLTGTRYVRVTPAQSPFDIGRDPDERHLVSCNYLIEKEPS